ncbi:hypothetical protein BS78_08G104300 [Paspalum vaginatum]|nr:hypothetical protein BS78_08G104300 [Paspalum vaginatum]
MQNDTVHLGHPLLLTYRNRNVAYNFLINKFRIKLTCLKAGTLSHAGSLVYINLVLTSIPIYYMTNILLPKDLLENLKAIIRNFWWKGQQSEGTTKSICFRAWDDIFQPKHLGGLGIKNIATVNKSLVIHSAWMVAANEDPLLSKVLKSKYCPHTSFWKAPLTGSRSVFWSSVQAVKHHIHDNSLYQIHEGKINIWSDPWCSIWDSIHPHLNMDTNIRPLPNQVQDLWHQNIKIWNIDLVNQIVDHQAA